MSLNEFFASKCFLFKIKIYYFLSNTVYIFGLAH